MVKRFDFTDMQIELIIQALDTLHIRTLPTGGCGGATICPICDLEDEIDEVYNSEEI